MKSLPILQKSERNREYNNYPDEIRDKVVYEYLFNGKSHREMDKEIIGLENQDSRGWQSMGILHFLGLTAEYKKIFANEDIDEVIGELNKKGDDYRSITLILTRYKLNQYSDDEFKYFTINQTIKPLEKSIGSSQYTDGARIEKEYHNIFNPIDSKYYTARGTARKIKVLFNNRIFDAEYRYEGQTDPKIHLERIGFKKELKDEFGKVFPDCIGEFLIFVGIDLLHFTFNIQNSISMNFNEDFEEYPEGEASYKIHKVLERNPKVIKDAKQQQIKAYGFLFCEICKFRFDTHYGERGDGFIEGHHKKMVSQMDAGEKTKIEDIALLCSNCHRMIHRKPQTTIEDMRKNYIM